MQTEHGKSVGVPANGKWAGSGHSLYTAAGERPPASAGGERRRWTFVTNVCNGGCGGPTQTKQSFESIALAIAARVCSSEVRCVPDRCGHDSVAPWQKSSSGVPRRPRGRSKKAAQGKHHTLFRGQHAFRGASPIAFPAALRLLLHQTPDHCAPKAGRLPRSARSPRMPPHRWSPTTAGRRPPPAAADRRLCHPPSPAPPTSAE